MRYVDLGTALQIAERRGWGPVRDVGLLESALHRPASTVFGEPAYPGIAVKAAALLHSLCGNHALVDGNKRLAWHLTRIFCALNDVAPGADEDEAFALVLDVCTGLDDLAAIAKRLRLRPAGRAVPPPRSR